MTVFVALGEVCEASQLILRYSGCFCVSHLQRDSLRHELLTLSRAYVSAGKLVEMQIWIYWGGVRFWRFIRFPTMQLLPPGKALLLSSRLQVLSESRLKAPVSHGFFVSHLCLKRANSPFEGQELPCQVRPPSWSRSKDPSLPPHPLLAATCRTHRVCFLFSCIFISLYFEVWPSALKRCQFTRSAWICLWMLEHWCEPVKFTENGLQNPNALSQFLRATCSSLSSSITHNRNDDNCHWLNQEGRAINYWKDFTSTNPHRKVWSQNQQKSWASLETSWIRICIILNNGLLR